MRFSTTRCSHSDPAPSADVQADVQVDSSFASASGASGVAGDLLGDDSISAITYCSDGVTDPGNGPEGFFIGTPAWSDVEPEPDSQSSAASGSAVPLGDSLNSADGGQEDIEAVFTEPQTQKAAKKLNSKQRRRLRAAQQNSRPATPGGGDVQVGEHEAVRRLSQAIQCAEHDLFSTACGVEQAVKDELVRRKDEDPILLGQALQLEAAISAWYDATGPRDKMVQNRLKVTQLLCLRPEGLRDINLLIQNGFL